MQKQLRITNMLWRISARGYLKHDFYLLSCRVPNHQIIVFASQNDTILNAHLDFLQN